MQIGNLGTLIIFEVSSSKVFNFSEMSQTVKARWAQHQPISGKPVSEFQGADLRTITLNIRLDAMHGVPPRATLEYIESACEYGIHYPFVIGGKKIGLHDWVITEISEKWGEIIKDGRLCSAKMTLTLQEYV